MAHIIEVERHSKAEACSFLDALFYSDSVSAIGYRPDGKKMRVGAVNWDEAESSEIDVKTSAMISNSLESGEDLDEIVSYCRIFPETILYKGELSDN